MHREDLIDELNCWGVVLFHVGVWFGLPLFACWPAA